MGDKMDNLIIKLEHFFQADFEIKKIMYDMAPSSLKYDDELSIQKYTDRLNELLLYIFSELKCIALDFFGKDSNVTLKIFDVEKTVKEQFYSCGFNIDKLTKFYEICISNMTIDFINNVKKECVGYSSGGTTSI